MISLGRSRRSAAALKIPAKIAPPRSRSTPAMWKTSSQWYRSTGTTLRVPVDVRERHLRLLTETIAAVNSTLDLEEVLGLVASNVADVLGADACLVYLYDQR